jgi:hypothetical protein
MISVRTLTIDELPDLYPDYSLETQLLIREKFTIYLDSEFSSIVLPMWVVKKSQLT